MVRHPLPALTSKVVVGKENSGAHFWTVTDPVMHQIERRWNWCCRIVLHFLRSPLLLYRRAPGGSFEAFGLGLTGQAAPHNLRAGSQRPQAGESLEPST